MTAARPIALFTAGLLFSGAVLAQGIVVASTTSTEQSGLFGHLLPQFKAATGITSAASFAPAGRRCAQISTGEVSVSIALSDPGHFGGEGGLHFGGGAVGDDAADDLGLLVWQDLPLRGSYATRTRGAGRAVAPAAVDAHVSTSVACNTPYFSGLRRTKLRPSSS